MVMLAICVVSLSVFAHVTLGYKQPRQSVDCPDTCVTSGAHVITTRGSLEPPGPGMMGVLSDKIASSCAGSDTEVRIPGIRIEAGHAFCFDVIEFRNGGR